jgi:hypothetical protein
METKLPIAESFDVILACNDRPEETIDIPEWGCSVVVREPDAETMVRISASSERDGKMDTLDYMSKVIVAGVVRPAMSAAHVEALKKKSNTAVLRLFNRITGKKNEQSKS